VVWVRGEPPPRKPRLSRERIVAAAVDLLDAEGVDGFSMRRLAARLDAGTMSLYEYVASREDVLDLALDAALGEIELTEPPALAAPPEPAGPPGPAALWRPILTESATETRGVMLRHPWIPTLIGTRPLLGPASLARSERAYAALHGAGLDGLPLIAAISALFSYVHGYVAAENTWRTQGPDEADGTELRRQAQAHLDEHASLYPTLSSSARLEYDDLDEGFTLGLTIVLDGIEAQVAAAG
jgi:AcrR family transcriptional regulator